ncbi:MAG: hypothetical protein V4679_00530 [Pseudomonadota bacterium]
MQKKILLQLALVAVLSACGGGGGDGATPSPQPRQVGEVFGTPAQVATADIVSNAGYGGYSSNLESSRAIQKAGKANLLDFLFLFPTHDRGQIRLVENAAARLDSYIAQNSDLLVPGVHVYLIDEMYLGAARVEDNPVEYQAQLDDLKRGIALVRQKLPTAKVGISFSPHATFGNPKIAPFIPAAIAQVDWVGTTSYWLGDKATTSALHEWSRTLPGIARAAQPKVETWYIAQAFREPEWDKQAFRDYMQTELQISDSYDAIIFFGWQETSELSRQTAGRFFEAETRALYSRFLKN